MSYCTRAIEKREQQVKEALQALEEQVRQDIPVGTLVEYQHGERWVGPCELIGWHGPWWAGVHGPDASLRNIKTGKTIRIGSYRRIRAYQGVTS